MLARYLRNNLDSPIRYGAPASPGAYPADPRMDRALNLMVLSLLHQNHVGHMLHNRPYAYDDASRRRADLGEAMAFGGQHRVFPEWVGMQQERKGGGIEDLNAVLGQLRDVYNFRASLDPQLFHQMFSAYTGGQTALEGDQRARAVLTARHGSFPQTIRDLPHTLGHVVDLHPTLGPQAVDLAARGVYTGHLGSLLSILHLLQLHPHQTDPNIRRPWSDLAYGVTQNVRHREAEASQIHSRLQDMMGGMEGTDWRPNEVVPEDYYALHRQGWIIR